MIALQRGDKLPSVAFVQALLNTRIQKNIPVDGDFGPLTEQTIKQFQVTTKCTSPTGRLDDLTWNALKRNYNFSVVDVIDICHPEVIKILELDLEFNKNPIVLGCMSNAVSPLINKIISENQPGSVVLLRFVGHGSQGLQAVGLGRGWQEIMGTDKARKLNSVEEEMYKNVFRYSSIGGSKKRGLQFIKEKLRSLVPVFSPYGCIQFHGCHIAQGLEGRHFLQDVAEITRVPATAGFGGQSMGKMPRFCGQTYTAFPGGTTMNDWAKQLPQFNFSFA